MPDTPSLLRKQEQWQHARSRMSWAEKLRQSEQVRDGLQVWVSSRNATPSMMVREDRKGYLEPGTH